jgi:sulfate adenylyltransferase
MTKIVATISPLAPISSGVDLVRINGAFGDFEEILCIIKRARGVGDGKKIIIDLPMGRKKRRTSIFSDEELLEFCLNNKVEYVSISYVKHPNEVINLRKVIKKYSSIFSPKIVSKIETKEALDNLDEIIKESDMIMIDRRDLATAVGTVEIPIAQKLIIDKCKESATPVIVASEALLSMVNSSNPSIADLMDIANSVLMGADYVMLSEETAIGKYPVEVVEIVEDFISKISSGGIVKVPDQIIPHGGILINRFLSEDEKEQILRKSDNYSKIDLTEEQLMDVDKIAIGAFSPIEGFMNRKDLESVLDNMVLGSGIVWSMPIVLDVDECIAEKIYIGQDVILRNPRDNKLIAILHLEDKYIFDRGEYIKKFFNTNNHNHPGVSKAFNLKPIFLGGKIDLLERPRFDLSKYEITPTEARDIFKEKKWKTIAGFHTRNIVHRAHEHLQKCTLEVTDGLFISPIIKVADESWPERLKLILKSYKTIIENYYPKNNVLLSPILTYSRFAGPREAIFTALMRKNYGCTHFIVGRDHCGVESYYDKYDSHKIFDKFDKLGIKPFLFKGPFYCKKCEEIVSEKTCGHASDNHIDITGLVIKEAFKKGKIPAEEFIRPEVLEMIIQEGNMEDLFTEK